MKPALRLTDGAVVLTPYAGEHVNELVAAVRESIAALGAFLPWAHAGYGMRDATDWVRDCAHGMTQGLNHQFAVLEGARFVGGMGLRVTDQQNRVASLGYWLRTSATGRGLCTRGVRIAARHAFETLGVMRIEIYARPENARSRRVAELAGARYECVARNRIFQHGSAYDAALYSLIPADLQRAGA